MMTVLRNRVPPIQGSLLTLALATCFDCAADNPSVSSGGPPANVDTTQPSEEPYHEPTCEENAFFCEADDGAPPSTSDQACATTPIDLEPAGVNVMIAVDGSNLMTSYWSTIQSAVKRMLEENPGLSFGAHLFWPNLAANIEEATAKFNLCGTTNNNVLDPAPSQLQQTLNHIGATPPGPAISFTRIDGSEVGYVPQSAIAPLNYYLENPTTLGDPNTTNYLVFISSGIDNCFGTVFANNRDKNLTFEKLAVELVKHNIRVLPIGFNADALTRIRRGENVSTNFEALDVLARSGGTGLQAALAADDEMELQHAIDTVSKAIRSCRFRIPAVLDPNQNLNPFELQFLVNDRPVSRDRTQTQGWNFVDGDTSEVEIFGDACVAVQAGKSVTAQKVCNPGAVCGRAATRVETKTRAVEYLFDASLSMTACIDPPPDEFTALLGGTWCYAVPPPPGEEYLTLWEAATRSVSQSLVAPVNDDVEFGLRFFPSKANAATNACLMASPEVAIADGAEISIMAEMAGNLPVAVGTPLVPALEQLAGEPGRLADPNVSGAVVVLSDGGNSCNALSSAEAVQRLSQAASTLLAQGVKVYAIRFGEGNADVADQDAQLRAIASSGGTAIGDPNDLENTPYLNAPAPEELNAALSSISDQLASCSFTLGAFDGGVDKTNANFYINGEVIPFDAQNTQQDGWGWADEAKTEIELYGDACRYFKDSRATSIVIELGCAPVVVL